MGFGAQVVLVVLASIPGVIPAVGSTSDAQSMHSLAVNHVQPLKVSEVEIPKARCYTSKGSYPQIVGIDSGAAKVNIRISTLFLKNERQDDALGLKGRAEGEPYACPGIYYIENGPEMEEINNRQIRGPGTYISASTRVVSLISPIEAAPPDGTTGGGYFLSITVNVQTNTVVHLNQLFTKSRSAFTTIKQYVEREAFRSLGKSFCYGGAPQSIKPRSNSFSNYSLSSQGLVIGMSGETICPWFVETVIPYASLTPDLSHLGKWLIEGVRVPLR
jgi:hypothetical protein